MSEYREATDLLRRSLHRDIDEDSMSAIPPGAIIGTVAAADREANVAIQAIIAGYLLRRMMRGWSADDIATTAASYLGLTELGLDQQLADLRRTCPYANMILAGTIDRSAALTQMMTWDGAVRRVAESVLDEVLDVYRREGRREFTPPEPESGRPDGDIRNDSFSTCAPHVRLQVLRFLRHDPEVGGVVRLMLVLAGVFAAALLGTLALFLTGHWVWGALLTPVTWLAMKGARLALHLPRVLAAMRAAYQGALLTPAIIERLEPLTVVCLAALGNGMGGDFWGLKRLQLRSLPVHPLRVGELFPCVSVFERGAAQEHWVDFTPRPIAWGTGDEAKIRDLVVKMGTVEPGHLRRCLREGILPQEVGKVLILDAAFRPVDAAPRAGGSAAPRP